MRRACRWVLVALSTTACGGGGTDAPDRPDAPVGVDVGTAGPVLDAGFIVDADPRPDATPKPADAGFARDATAPDAGFVDAGAPGAPPDPALPGPHLVSQLASTTTAPRSGNVLPVDCRYSAGPAEPRPVVMIGRGFQIPAEVYAGYAVRLASFGYVACIVDYPTPLVGDHVENAEDVLAGLDYVLSEGDRAGSSLQGRIDSGRIGMMGHSLGGKIAFMAADIDPRVAAVFGLDPVDGGALCAPGRCPDASALLPFAIPVGVMGETLDGMGALQACAPFAENFQTFFDRAVAPALEVEVLGASHVSFVDDLAACGLPCALCNPPVVSQQAVLDIARAYTVAFFERYLRGDTRYAAFLTGSIASQRYVSTGLVAIRSR